MRDETRGAIVEGEELFGRFQFENESVQTRECGDGEYVLELKETRR